eukprot:3354411-Rhodomonas_salina.6
MRGHESVGRQNEEAALCGADSSCVVFALARVLLAGGGKNRCSEVRKGYQTRVEDQKTRGSEPRD